MKHILLATSFVALLSTGAQAAFILTDSWTMSPPTDQSGTLPLITTNTASTSNFGMVTPASNPFSQTLARNIPVTNFLFVAAPRGSGINKAEIPFNFTLTDNSGGTGSFVAFMNYFANFQSMQDDMAWSETKGVSGQRPPNTPPLDLLVTLSDGAVIGVSIAYSIDWNMGQKITYTLDSVPGTVGTLSVAPEPSALIILATSAMGLMWARKSGRKTCKREMVG